MSSRSLLPVALCLGLLFGCGDSLPATNSSILPSKMQTSQITLEVSKEDGFIVSITNTTNKPVVFAARADFVAVYHESPNGRRTAVTWDGSNADMKLLSPFEVVNLRPKCTYILRLSLWIDPQHKVDKSQNLKEKGTLFAVVKPLGVGHFDQGFQKEASKWALLSGEMRSQNISTPILVP